jgi:hypothetical protein
LLLMAVVVLAAVAAVVVVAGAALPRLETPTAALPVASAVVVLAETMEEMMANTKLFQ